MGDRDGDDERASEEPGDSHSEESPADEQQVPSSTAVDAKADDASDATEDSVEDSADHPEDEDGAPDSDDDPQEWWKDHDPENEVDESGDDEELSPAARRDQTQARGDARRADEADDSSDADDSEDSGADADDSSDADDGDADDSEEPKQVHAPGPTPKGGGTAASATARPTRDREPPSPPDDVGPSTAPDDEEMPLTEHVEEMALRFLAVGLVMFGVAGIVVFYANDLINFLWYSFLGDPALCPGPDCGVKPRVYHPLSLVLARLKVSTLVGLIIALPVGVYQTYRFMRPGLYPRERRYYLAAVPTSLVLAVVGVGFAYFAVLPSLFAYFTEYSEQAATTAFGLTETFNLMVLMLGFFALVFQIPLLVMLAIMMGVTTRQWLEDRRLYFWGGFAAVAFLFSPDPTGMAPLIVAVTMIVLFEGTLTLLRWTGTGSPIPTAEEAADRRPAAYLAAALGGYVASSGPIPPGYYDALPQVVIDQLASSGGPIATPAIIAGALIALFEIGAFLLRRYGRSRRALKARLAVEDARIPVWLGAVVVGYFGSPTPTLVTAARDLALSPTRAALVGVGLVVLYELFVAVLRWREGDDDAQTPTTDEA
ncbi:MULTISPECIES: twin-arginine translocase subunit TatC [Halomicrobium]|uniref:Sec-independent protein translocase protein TatC n=2 Tax=Halomicrobium mukohataei TaxID=57705 RepID=C7P1B8_HALMD|nr:MULTISPECIES: twin-arginine translocase subunit TatC [Halomicrobium]ACV47126.1 Sec-independent periplasmic protein translocase [Halomicrobium mukohataei DSM 12286]QCD65609.1 preprotein translocase subunit TatC [Halomicrobium mukohataei]QFR20415.1 preprotein translocase subunit TatC [Halomicrobium sp. ZPS1]